MCRTCGCAESDVRVEVLDGPRVAEPDVHPHPHFTPDGARVIYNDTNRSNQVRVALVSIAS